MKLPGSHTAVLLAIALIAVPIIVVLMTGLFTLQPNQARVLVLFGAYKGTVRTPGFHWGNPFYSNGPQQAASWRANLAAAKTGAQDARRDRCPWDETRSHCERAR